METGSGTSGNNPKTGDQKVVDAGQDEKSVKELGETSTTKNTSSIKNVEQDTESFDFDSSCSESDYGDYSDSPSDDTDDMEKIYEEFISKIKMNPGDHYHNDNKLCHAPPIEEKKISTVNDILKVNSMVEQLLPYLEKEKISSISASICEFPSTAVLESDEHSRSIVFAYEKNKLSISVDTIVQLVENKCLREVDLMLPENELPDIEGKSRKEILDILASGGGEDHENLIECLTRLDIEHIVSPYTKNIFVRNFTGLTIFKIGELICELQTDLSISGGGPCDYQINSANQPQQLPSESSTQEYQRKVANSHCQLKLFRVRNTKIGVIDSGCSYSLYQELSAKGTVVMHNKMINAKNSKRRAYDTDYEDCFVQDKPYKMRGHGTGVVEIIGNCVLSGTKICVANTGYPFYPSNVECAMMELYERSVDILNCSFFVPNNSNLARSLKKIKKKVTDFVVVAAVGNDRLYDFIENGLDDGRTIFVGSHNDQNSISKFSTSQCRVDICSRGEQLYIASVEPNLCQGTSFAVSYVTAAVAIVLSHLPLLDSDLKSNLQSTAQDLTCGCKQHEGRKVRLKFDPESFMYACFRDEPV